jgi:hypothetical protein
MRSFACSRSMVCVVIQVLDFEGGGDLLNLLVERDTFDEGFTKFYVAEVRSDELRITDPKLKFGGAPDEFGA